MAIYKNKDITTNIESEKLSINNSNTSFYTEDKGSAALRIFIKYRDGAFNLNDTKLTPVLDLFHADGSIWLDEPLEEIMSDKGILQYNIPDNVIAHAGQIKAKLFLRNVEQSVHVANFTFDIKDSGIEGAVEKEISVNIVDDAVRRIVKENAIEILGDEYKEKINQDVVSYIASNPDKYKGSKGDKGEQGPEGPEGPKGDKGEQGDDGLSAYQLAVNNGYEGTESDWLNSLKAFVTDQELQDIKEQIVNSTIPPSIIEVPTCASRNRAAVDDLRSLNNYGLNFTSFTDGYITSFEVFSEAAGIIEFYITNFKGLSVPSSKEYKRIRTKLKRGWNTIDFVSKIESNKEYCIAVNFIDSSRLAVATNGSYDDANIQNAHLVKPNMAFNPLNGASGTAYLFIFNIKIATDTNSRLLLNQITSSTY